MHNINHSERLPYEKLAVLGIDREKADSLPQEVQEKLASGEVTPLLQVSISARNGDLITLPLKLQLVSDKYGNPALMAYPVRAVLEKERNQVLCLTEQEAERLKKGEVIQKAVEVNGEKTQQYLQLDPETKSVIHRRVTDVQLEQKLKDMEKVNDIELGMQQKQQVREGKPIELNVGGEKEGLKGVARLLGNNAKKLSDTDFFPIAMGIVLGVLFGKINISFSDSLSFSPGLTGGVLMVALVLSAIGKTGPIIWSMSGPANQLLRQLGLLLFLAEVGTSAGKNLVATFQESGLLMFGVGAAITLVPMLVAAIVGHFVFKISLLDLLGTITGGMTSTPGLAAADSMVDSNIPSVAYATVYPIAMVFLILFIQVIASAVY